MAKPKNGTTLFKSDDFKLGLDPLDISLNSQQRGLAASIANRLLEERGVRVYMIKRDDHLPFGDVCADQYPYHDSQALLVCVEPLPAKVCEHQPRIGMEFHEDKFVYIPECKHCGVALKAKWEVSE